MIRYTAAINKGHHSTHEGERGLYATYHIHRFTNNIQYVCRYIYKGNRAINPRETYLIPVHCKDHILHVHIRLQ